MRSLRLSLTLMRSIRSREKTRTMALLYFLFTAKGCSNTFISLRALTSAIPGISSSEEYPAFDIRKKLANLCNPR